jgi:hypothetical protein
VGHAVRASAFHGTLTGFLVEGLTNPWRLPHWRVELPSDTRKALLCCQAAQRLSRFSAEPSSPGSSTIDFPSAPSTIREWGYRSNTEVHGCPQQERELIATFDRQCSISKIRTGLPRHPVVAHPLSACEQSTEGRGSTIACVTAMRKQTPFPEVESPRSDLRHQPPPRANHNVCSVGTPPGTESLRSRFNPRLVGFGIISSLTRTPNVKEHLSRNVQAAEKPSGRNLEDRK